jgi:CheY-like chemotaxis protein
MSKIKLLLAGDAELFKHLDSTLLGRDDFAVNTTDNVEEVHRLANEWSPDLMLLDLDMANMGGDEICRQLKGCASTDHIPIIMIIKDGGGDAITRCLAAGCEDVITAPIQQDYFHLTIEKHLSVRSRKYKRTRVTLPAMLTDDEDLRGIIHTLSPRGAFIEMDPPPSPGRLMTIDFTLPESNDQISLKGIVRWSRRIKDSHPDGAGFEFVDIDENTTDIIYKATRREG